MYRYRVAAVALLLLLTGCLFDSGTDHIVDHYEVTWIDLHAQRALYNKAEVVPAYVFAVGYTDHYLFVKQHPFALDGRHKVNEAVTHYYLIERTQQEGQDKPVYGPLSEPEFSTLCRKLDVTDIQFSTHYPESS